MSLSASADDGMVLDETEGSAASSESEVDVLSQDGISSSGESRTEISESDAGLKDSVAIHADGGEKRNVFVGPV